MGVDHSDKDSLHQEISRLWRELRRVAKATLQNSSIGRAGLRVYGGGWIRIINGGLQVVGSAIVEGLLEITGNLTGSGQFLWTGPWELQGDGQITGDLTGSGPFLWTGPWELRGDGQITGDVEIDGKARIKNEATLEDDLIVTSDGRILVGGMTIAQVGASGEITFPNGARVHAASGGGVRMTHNNASVTVTDAGASISYLGVGVRADSTGVRINPLGLGSISISGTPPDLLYIDPDGYLYKTY